jgi:hypothetical protein
METWSFSKFFLPVFFRMAMGYWKIGGVCAYTMGSGERAKTKIKTRV